MGIAVTVHHNRKSAFCEPAYKLKNAAGPDLTCSNITVQLFMNSFLHSVGVILKIFASAMGRF